MQVAFGWTDEHLHRFVVHGSDYDAYAGDDLRQTSLSDLGLRTTERFIYDYDFGDLWRHDIRVEQILAALLADMMEHPDARLGDYSEPLGELRPWFDLDRFDRRAVNRALTGLGDPERRVA